MADGSITVEVSTQAAHAELQQVRDQNATLKRDLVWARDGLTKGRTRMREDNERLAREAHTWRKAAETYAKQAQRMPLAQLALPRLCRRRHLRRLLWRACLMTTSATAQTPSTTRQLAART